MYTARIVDKQIIKDKLVVGVEFTNGIETFSQTFETTQQQDGTWIGTMIEKKLQNLNSLPDLGLSINVGDFSKLPINTERETYRKNALDYNRYMDIARMGLIDPGRQVITDLRTWLRDNFKDEYVDLF